MEPPDIYFEVGPNWLVHKIWKFFLKKIFATTLRQMLALYLSAFVIRITAVQLVVECLSYPPCLE
jgi:hypothetical protein